MLVVFIIRMLGTSIISQEEMFYNIFLSADILVRFGAKGDGSIVLPLS